jgi:hypothetical protein
LKNFPETNTQAYFAAASLPKKKMFLQHRYLLISQELILPSIQHLLDKNALPARQ